MAACPLTFADLPDTLAVFPLTGALLLPTGHLPLNIFEPRYLAMFRDAMATPHRLIGMVQTLPPLGEMGSAELYTVGCAGRLTAFSETQDGRYLVALSGVIRFDILDELPMDIAGYRRVRPDFLGYDSDLTLNDGQGLQLDAMAQTRLISAMQAYFEAKGFDTDWAAVRQASAIDLLTSLAMACPFTPAEKQALLEAGSQEDQLKTLESLLTIGALNTGEGQP